MRRPAPRSRVGSQRARVTRPPGEEPVRCDACPLKAPPCPPRSPALLPRVLLPRAPGPARAQPAPRGPPAPSLRRLEESLCPRHLRPPERYWPGRARVPVRGLRRPGAPGPRARATGAGARAPGGRARARRVGRVMRLARRASRGPLIALPSLIPQPEDLCGAFQP